MRIVVIGAGKVGAEICRQLAEEDYDVIVVDRDRSTLAALLTKADVMGIVGAGELAAVQKEADVSKADLVIAVTESDETNILCCLIAKALNARHTIARVRDPELAEQSEFMRKKLGINLIANPEYETAVEISRLLRYPAAAAVDYSDKARVDIVASCVETGNPLIGKSLAAVSDMLRLKILFCAVERGGDAVIPRGDFVFAEGDRIYITGKYLSIDAFFKRCGIPSVRIKNALIVGGGRISQYVANSLHESGIAVKIIERDRALCETLADELPQATIVCGDGSDKIVLREEGAGEVDAVLLLTGSDETNIMLSLYAKGLGDKKTISKIDNESFVEIAETLGLDCVISPKTVMSQAIVRYVRSLQIHDESVLSSYKLAADKCEATAFSVTYPEIIGRPLRSLRLRKDVLIACVDRRSSVIIPDGDTVLAEGDTVLVVSTGLEPKRIEDIFEPGARSGE